MKQWDNNITFVVGILNFINKCDTFCLKPYRCLWIILLFFIKIIVLNFPIIDCSCCNGYKGSDLLSNIEKCMNIKSVIQCDFIKIFQIKKL